MRTDERASGLTLLEVTGAGDAVVPELHVALDDVTVQHARGADEAVRKAQNR